MGYIVDSICLLNSSYSKDKVLTLFKKILQKASVDDFILLSSLVQTSTTHSISEGNEFTFKCGNHEVFFRYAQSKDILTVQDIKVIIAGLIVAIENCSIYNDITDKIASGENKSYPTFNNLIADISKEVEVYKRYGTDFCLSKISMENVALTEKFNLKMNCYIKKVQEIVRVTDSVYKDNKNIYILYRNVGIADGAKLIDKLKSSMPECQIGIAEWKPSFVIVDLLGELDSYMYLMKATKETSDNHLSEEFNRILNKALFFNHDIIVVFSSELTKETASNKVLSFSINNIDYSVLKNVEDTSVFTFVYKFKGDELAEDIFLTLKANKKEA